MKRWEKYEETLCARGWKKPFKFYFRLTRDSRFLKFICLVRAGIIRWKIPATNLVFPMPLIIGNIQKGDFFVYLMLRISNNFYFFFFYSCRQSYNRWQKFNFRAVPFSFFFVTELPIFRIKMRHRQKRNQCPGLIIN